MTGPTPVLPQDETGTNAVRRKEQLTTRQQQYQYTYNVVGDLPILANIPDREAFSAKYIAERALATAPILANAAGLKIRQRFDPLDKLQDYEDFYPALPDPTTVSDWNTDTAFADARLSGPNPMVLTRVSDWAQLSNTAFSESHLKQLLGSRTSKEQLIQQGLFMVDYSELLAGLRLGIYPGGTKYVPEPVALFRWATTGIRDRGQLLPVAIQVDTGKGSKIVVTPMDGATTWSVAKTVVQIADANHHEMFTHLGRTHFVMESFGISTERHLAESHPVKILLHPHLRFMLFNNNLGVERLVNPGGPVDTLLGGSLEESLNMCSRAVKSWSITGHSLRNDLSARGVENADFLPHFPYRDDALILDDAIRKYVKKYVALYYATPAKLSADAEIQAWANELSQGKESNGGCVLDMPQSLSSVEELADILATVIFTCSVQHSAVNYSQWDYEGYIPNMPLAGYADYMEAFKKKNVDMDFYMKLLPPNLPTQQQIAVMRALTAYRYDRLGDYAGDLADPLAVALVEGFCSELDQISRTIARRNKSRKMPYTVLLPENIINSISI